MEEEKKIKRINNMIRNWEYRFNNYKRIQESYMKERKKYENGTQAWKETTIKISSARTSKLLCGEAISGLTEILKNV